MKHNQITLLPIFVVCSITLLNIGKIYAADAIPENSQLSRNGHSWVCDKGYWKNIKTKSCDKVNVPENVYLAYDGASWVCDKGYIRNNRKESCDKIHLPENGLLSSDGHSWYCEKGYQENMKERRCDKTVE
jgi:hypothetical protein